MKIFQVLNGFCWWDATSTVGTLEKAGEMFAPTCVFVEAPDYVFEGWGFDIGEEGDARFIQPESPVGYRYDAKSGTFAPNKTKAEQLEEMVKQMRDMLAEAEAQLAELSQEAKK